MTMEKKLVSGICNCPDCKEKVRYSGKIEVATGSMENRGRVGKAILTGYCPRCKKDFKATK